MHSQKCFLFFNRRKQKQKYFNFVKKRLVIAVVFNKKSKKYMFEIRKKLQPKILYVSWRKYFLEVVIQICSEKKVRDNFKTSWV